MTCAPCRRLRDFFFGRSPSCEACEHAMRAVRQHERSTQNLTRAALDQIDQSAAFSGHVESKNDIRTLVEDMLRSMDPPRETTEGGRR